jgi:hypothetical protein
VVVLTLFLWVLAAAAAQLRCSTAAAAAGHAWSAGAPLEVVRALAARDAPGGATILITRSGRYVAVSVSVTVRPFGGLLRNVPGITVGNTVTELR